MFHQVCRLLISNNFVKSKPKLERLVVNIKYKVAKAIAILSKSYQIQAKMRNWHVNTFTF